MLPGASKEHINVFELWALERIEAIKNVSEALVISNVMLLKGQFPRIEALHKDLSSLLYLATKHSLSISLEDFRAFPQDRILECMMEQATPDSLKETINGPVRSCAKYFDISLDEFLSTHILNSLSCEKDVLFADTNMHK